MFKRILFLPTVFFLVLAVSLWTVPAQAAQSQQVPLNPKTIPQFVDPLPTPHLIFDTSFNAQFKGAYSTFSAVPTPAVNDVIYLKALDGGNKPGYYKVTAIGPVTWAPVPPIELQMTEFQSQVLPGNAVPAYPKTWVWGYKGSGQAADPYIGPVIVAKRYNPGATPGPTNGAPTEIKFVNSLPTVKGTKVKAWQYSTDLTLHWADPLNAEANTCAKKIPQGNFATTITGNVYPIFGTECARNYGEDPLIPGTFLDKPIPAVVHLHGGEVPPMLDGGPDAWFAAKVNPTDTTWPSGHGYYSRDVAAQGGTPNGNYATYVYPNTQEAANIWFHDHVLGITRLNVYAGLAGAYLIYDPALNLPTGLRPFGLTSTPTDTSLTGDTPIIPLVIQDRMFDTAGDLFFPADTANNVVWTPNPDHPYWVPEFVGDTIVVNGKVWPTLGTAALPIPAKRYRFLFLNGSNARTYELQIPGVPRMYVIGTDGGYLDTPAQVKKLVIMPGERYDVIIDFAGLPPGPYIMTNSAKTPYPRGAQPQGATVGRIMQFWVGGAPAVPDASYNPAAVPVVPIRSGAQVIKRLVNTATGLPAVTPTVTRLLTLNEALLLPSAVPNPVVPDPVNPTVGLLTAYPGGPVEILVNNTKYGGEMYATGGGTLPIGTPVYRTDFTAVTMRTNKTWYYSELPIEGQTERWDIINLTADAHPIHLHLVQFQLMKRQNFDVAKYTAAYNMAFQGVTTSPNSSLADFGCTAGLYCPGYGPPLSYGTGAVVGGNPPVAQFLAKNFALPNPEEQGWKDTVVAMPGMVTSLMVRWAPTDVPAGQTGYFPFNPDGGHGYVWHCHIIDHEDNEMMRPTSVTVPSGAPANRALVLGTHY